MNDSSTPAGNTLSTIGTSTSSVWWNVPRLISVGGWEWWCLSAMEADVVGNRQLAGRCWREAEQAMYE